LNRTGICSSEDVHTGWPTQRPYTPAWARGQAVAETGLDAYPDAFPVTRNTKGNTPFSNYAPFGRSGRFLYGRVSFGF